jgi:transposase
MGRRLTTEEAMTIEVLHARGVAKRAIGRQLGVDEKAVRYRLLHPRRPERRHWQPMHRDAHRRRWPKSARLRGWPPPNSYWAARAMTATRASS